MVYRTLGKRLLDILLSLIGLAVILPIFLIVVVFIRMDSRGPVFFVQKRMGRQGRLFSLLKFRTMESDREREQKGFEPGFSLRVTRVGKLLRRTKLDELPQLVNVLKGDMSFVGPRPEVERYRAFYAGRFENVLSVRPGITDMASIKYRHEEKLLAESPNPQSAYQDVILPDKLEMALRYVQGNISLGGDINIIFKTLLSILVRVK